MHSVKENSVSRLSLLLWHDLAPCSQSCTRLFVVTGSFLKLCNVLEKRLGREGVKGHFGLARRLLDLSDFSFSLQIAIGPFDSFFLAAISVYGQTKKNVPNRLDLSFYGAWFTPSQCIDVVMTGVSVVSGGSVSTMHHSISISNSGVRADVSQQKQYGLWWILCRISQGCIILWWVTEKMW